MIAGSTGSGSSVFFVLDDRDALCKPHHPLESPAVVGGAIAVPGGDTARQDALNGASVKVCEGFR